MIDMLLGKEWVCVEPLQYVSHPSAAISAVRKIYGLSLVGEPNGQKLSDLLLKGTAVLDGQCFGKLFQKGSDSLGLGCALGGIVAAIEYEAKFCNYNKVIKAATGINIERTTVLLPHLGVKTSLGQAIMFVNDERQWGFGKIYRWLNAMGL